MNFNRYKCQKTIEYEVGCHDPIRLGSYKDALTSYEIKDSNTLDNFIQSAHDDAHDFFYKSSISFLEATYSIFRNHSSWAIVKLYYSVFYSVRAILLLSGYAVIKDGKGGIYYLELKEGGRLKKISTKKVKGDHKTTIKAYKDIFGDTEILNTNLIDEKNVFDWIMDYRELVNYRVSSFSEPDYGYNVIPRLTSKSDDFDNQTQRYLDDPILPFCFDTEHSIYATPLVLLLRAKNKICLKGLCHEIKEERSMVIKSMLRAMRLGDSIVMSRVFCEGKSKHCAAIKE